MSESLMQTPLIQGLESHGLNSAVYQLEHIYIELFISSTTEHPMHSRPFSCVNTAGTVLKVNGC